MGVLWSAAAVLLYQESIAGRRSGLRPYAKRHRPIRRMAAEDHLRATNWSRAKVLQSPRTSDVRHLRKLVGRPARICRWRALSESNHRVDIWNTGRNLVVKSETRLQMATQQITTRSMSAQNVPAVAPPQSYT